MRIVFLLLGLAALFPPVSYAHSGRTDANGGHHDRKNGGYHYHNSGGTSAPRQPAPRTQPRSYQSPQYTPAPSARPSYTPQNPAYQPSVAPATPRVAIPTENPSAPIEYPPVVPESSAGNPFKGIEPKPSTKYFTHSEPKVIHGRVSKVVDGDVVEVEIEAVSEPLVVRVYGVDCPEKGQAYSEQARAFTSRHCLDQAVTVDVLGKDETEITVGSVKLVDGKSLNELLISAGMAWWDNRRAPAENVLKKLQVQAIGNQRGVWSEHAPMAPWDYKAK